MSVFRGQRTGGFGPSDPVERHGRWPLPGRRLTNTASVHRKSRRQRMSCWPRIAARRSRMRCEDDGRQPEPINIQLKGPDQCGAAFLLKLITNSTERSHRQAQPSANGQDLALPRRAAFRMPVASFTLTLRRSLLHWKRFFGLGQDFFQ